MSFQLTPWPMWDLESGRLELGNHCKHYLAEHRDRLKSFDIADYMPATPMDIANLERMGLPIDATIQIVGHLQYRGDEGHSKVFRVCVPRNIAHHELQKLARNIAGSMRAQCKIMELEEKQADARRLDILTGDGIADATHRPAPATHRLSAANGSGLTQDLVIDPETLIETPAANAAVHLESVPQ